MGTMYSAYIKSPDTTPNVFQPPTFDANYGFASGRKERVMHVTLEDMENAGLTEDERDYCAHKLIDFYKCRKQVFPFAARCKHQKHEWEQCEYEDYVLRMKEFERERRLLERRKRKGIASGEILAE